MFLLATLLTVLFAAAKIFHLIAWSWWLVFTPAIVGFGLPVVIAAVAFVIAVIAAMVN